MTYEWHYRKARRNLEKHGVEFTDAVGVLEDPLSLTMHDPDSDSEDRFLTLGSDHCGRVLVVAYAWRSDRVRIISARKATKRERLQYQGR